MCFGFPIYLLKINRFNRGINKYIINIFFSKVILKTYLLISSINIKYIMKFILQNLNIIKYFLINPRKNLHKIIINIFINSNTLNNIIIKFLTYYPNKSEYIKIFNLLLFIYNKLSEMKKFFISIRLV